MATSYDSEGWHVVIGLGSAGARHVSILQGLGLRNIAVVRTNQGPTVRPTPIGVRALGSLEKALDLRPVMAVVATPTSMHAAQALTLVEHDVPVLVEKPAAESPADAERLFATASSRGAPLAVGYHLRFHPAMAWLRAVVTGQLLGRPLLLRASWGEFLPGWHPNEDYSSSYSARADQGGGPLLTLSHVVDYSVGLLGLPLRVETRSWRVSELKIDVPDLSILTLTHQTGAVSEIEIDYFTRPPHHRVELRCANGSVEWDVNASTLKAFTADAAAGIVPPDISGATRAQCFVDQMTSFINLIDGGHQMAFERDLAVMRAIGDSPHSRRAS